MADINNIRWKDVTPDSIRLGNDWRDKYIVRVEPYTTDTDKIVINDKNTELTWLGGYLDKGFVIGCIFFKITHESSYTEGIKCEHSVINISGNVSNDEEITYKVAYYNADTDTIGITDNNDPKGFYNGGDIMTPPVKDSDPWTHVGVQITAKGGVAITKIIQFSLNINSSTKNNRWKTEVWDVYHENVRVYHKAKTIANCWTEYGMFFSNKYITNPGYTYELEMPIPEDLADFDLVNSYVFNCKVTNKSFWTIVQRAFTNLGTPLDMSSKFAGSNIFSFALLFPSGVNEEYDFSNTFENSDIYSWLFQSQSTGLVRAKLSGTFHGCKGLNVIMKPLPTSGFQPTVIKTSDLSNCFNGCASLNAIKGIIIDVSEIIDEHYIIGAFVNCNNLAILSIKGLRKEIIWNFDKTNESLYLPGLFKESIDYLLSNHISDLSIMGEMHVPYEWVSKIEPSLGFNLEYQLFWNMFTTIPGNYDPVPAVFAMAKRWTDGVNTYCEVTTGIPATSDLIFTWAHSSGQIHNVRVTANDFESSVVTHNGKDSFGTVTLGRKGSTDDSIYVIYDNIV